MTSVRFRERKRAALLGWMFGRYDMVVRKRFSPSMHVE